MTPPNPVRIEGLEQVSPVFFARSCLTTRLVLFVEFPDCPRFHIRSILISITFSPPSSNRSDHVREKLSANRVSLLGVTTLHRLDHLCASLGATNDPSHDFLEVGAKQASLCSHFRATLFLPCARDFHDRLLLDKQIISTPRTSFRDNPISSRRACPGIRTIWLFQMGLRFTIGYHASNWVINKVEQSYASCSALLDSAPA